MKAFFARFLKWGTKGVMDPKSAANDSLPSKETNEPEKQNPFLELAEIFNTIQSLPEPQMVAALDEALTNVTINKNTHYKSEFSTQAGALFLAAKDDNVRATLCQKLMVFSDENIPLEANGQGDVVPFNTLTSGRLAATFYKKSSQIWEENSKDLAGLTPYVERSLTDVGAWKVEEVATILEKAFCKTNVGDANGVHLVQPYGEADTFHIVMAANSDTTSYFLGSTLDA